MISIVLPSIRPYLLQGVYDSIQVDFPWELVIVSPYDLPDSLKDKKNIKFVKDFGSPVRASCIAANLCEGELFTYGADDGTFVSSTLSEAVKLLQAGNEKTVITTKYYEGSDVIQSDDYYKVGNAYLRTPYIDPEVIIFNCALMRKSYYDYLGGWDSLNFNTNALAHADLCLRANNDKAEVFFFKQPLLRCSHGHSDHLPVQISHETLDAPRLNQIYSLPDCVNRIKIDINNWKSSPSVWKQRF